MERLVGITADPWGVGQDSCTKDVFLFYRKVRPPLFLQSSSTRRLEVARQIRPCWAGAGSRESIQRVLCDSLGLYAWGMQLVKVRDWIRMLLKTSGDCLEKLPFGHRYPHMTVVGLLYNPIWGLGSECDPSFLGFGLKV